MREYLNLIEDAQTVPPATTGHYRFSTDHSGYSHGQHDMHLYAETGGIVVGKIDYTLYQGEVHIKMISVPPRLQRSGIGSALVRELQRLYPDVEIEWGSTTEAGETLRSRLSYDDVDIPENRAKIDRLEALKARLNSFEEAYKRIEASPDTPERHEALLALYGPWSEVQSELDRLEDETRWIKPTKRLVRPA